MTSQIDVTVDYERVIKLKPKSKDKIRHKCANAWKRDFKDVRLIIDKYVEMCSCVC